MRDAKDYKNTIELVAESIFEHIYGTSYYARNEQAKSSVIAVLNVINYFEGKTCSDCGYFDPTDGICFGGDREHQEQADNPICETFAPKELVEVI